jgi:hypothetical protein
MPYRYFVNAEGVRWRVWDVVPSLVDRRIQPRRLQRVRIRHRDRRVLPTRRIDMARSWLYFPPSERGWLCFESERERVRLHPIPPDWLMMEAEDLDGLCRSARHSGGESTAGAGRPGDAPSGASGYAD